MRVRKNIDKDDAKIWNTSIKITISGYQRRLINAYYGDAGMATLDRCRSFIEGNGKGALDDLDHIAMHSGLPGEANFDPTGLRLLGYGEDDD